MKFKKAIKLSSLMFATSLFLTTVNSLNDVDETKATSSDAHIHLVCDSEDITFESYLSNKGVGDATVDSTGEYGIWIKNPDEFPTSIEILISDNKGAFRFFKSNVKCDTPFRCDHLEFSTDGNYYEPIYSYEYTTYYEEEDINCYVLNDNFVNIDTDLYLKYVPVAPILYVNDVEVGDMVQSTNVDYPAYVLPGVELSAGDEIEIATLGGDYFQYTLDNRSSNQFSLSGSTLTASTAGNYVFNLSFNNSAKLIISDSNEWKVETFQKQENSSLYHGYIELSKAKAYPRKEVVVNVHPNEGFVLKDDTLIVNDSSVVVTKLEENKFSFLMPNANITVSAQFKDTAHVATLIPGNFTCENGGTKDYYKCNRCDLFFEDEDCTILIGDEFDVMPWIFGDGKLQPGHRLELVNGKAATTEANGYLDAYCCSVCGKYFEDAEGTREIGDKTAYDAWILAGGLVPQLPAPEKDAKLSGGAVAGIAVGAVVGTSLIAYVAMFVVWKKKKIGLKFLQKSFEVINTNIFKK